MPLRALKPAVLLSADSGATQQIPQRPQGLGPSPPPAAPSGSQSEPWMEALEAGMCEARLSGTLHPGCHFGVAQSFALSCSSSDFFFFWHICFLASFLYMCLGVWGEKKKHKEWVAPDPKLSPWKKEYKQHSCIMNFLDLHHMASEPPASRWPSWGRRHWSGLRQKGYRSLLLGQADLRTSLILLGQLSGILTSCLVTCSTCSAGCSLVTRYFACSLLPPAVSTTHHVAPFRSAALCLVQRIQGGAPRPSHDITYPNCLPQEGFGYLPGFTRNVFGLAYPMLLSGTRSIPPRLVEIILSRPLILQQNWAPQGLRRPWQSQTVTWVSSFRPDTSPSFRQGPALRITKNQGVLEVQNRKETQKDTFSCKLHKKFQELFAPHPERRKKMHP